MFDRLQKPFLTVETGEAYQPVRLTYAINNSELLIPSLEKLNCIKKTGNSWSWYWTAEVNDLHFESLSSYKKNLEHPLRLGTFTVKDSKLYLSLPSFKRACMSVPFFHRHLDLSVASIEHADFINKVFALDERLPHGFSEVFKEEELDRILNSRVEDYHRVKEQCEHASSAEEALSILAEFNKIEGKKRLPYAERYAFEEAYKTDPDVVFLSFYIFLRNRELVAIKRWCGQTGYSLADAVDETVEKVFGELGIDIIE